MTVFRPSAISEEAWGLTFPISMAMAGWLVRLPAARIGDLFFAEWRAEVYPDPVLIGLSDLLLIAVQLTVLEAVGVDVRDERVAWRPDPNAISRLRDAISNAWRLRKVLTTGPDVALLLGGPLPEGWWYGVWAPIVVDLNRVVVHLERRAARVTAADAAEPLGEELTDWLYDARRSVYQANRMMEESPPVFDGLIDGPGGQVSIRAEMFRALKEGQAALDTVIERFGDLQAALREER